MTIIIRRPHAADLQAFLDYRNDAENFTPCAAGGRRLARRPSICAGVAGRIAVMFGVVGTAAVFNLRPVVPNP